LNIEINNKKREKKPYNLKCQKKLLPSTASFRHRYAVGASQIILPLAQGMSCYEIETN